MTRIDKLLIIPRMTLALIMIFHGLGKLTALESFSEKFGLAPVWGVLASTAELLGAVGVALGVVINGKFGTTITILGVLAIACVQVPAIFMVHTTGFFYFTGGMEYNLTILALCLMLAVGVKMSYCQKKEERMRHDRERL